MKKIYILEDDKLLVRVYATKLKKAGFDMRFAEEADSFIDELKEYKPDLIIVDLVMSHSDGYQIISDIKNSEPIKNIPIMVLSNAVDDVSLGKTKELGAVKHLAKSDYSFKEIIDEIHDIFSS